MSSVDQCASRSGAVVGRAYNEMQKSATSAAGDHPAYGQATRSYQLHYSYLLYLLYLLTYSADVSVPRLAGFSLITHLRKNWKTKRVLKNISQNSCVRFYMLLELPPWADALPPPLLRAPRRRRRRRRRSRDPRTRPSTESSSSRLAIPSRLARSSTTPACCRR